MKIYIAVAAGFLLCMFNCFAQQSLKPGDKAPGLFIKEWVKGKPVSNFEKGKVYVVEFSFVSCAPCAVAIPHLSKIQQEFRDRVEVISIYTNESNRLDTANYAYLDRIRRFVKSRNEQMNYTVAADVSSQVTNDRWMKPSGFTGFPTAFIIERSGVVAWMGSPLNIDSALQLIVDGKYDYRKTAISSGVPLDFADNLVKRKNASDTAGLLRAVDSLIKIYPYDSSLFGVKFRVLSGTNDTAACALVKWMLDVNLTNFDWFHFAGAVTGPYNRLYFNLGQQVCDRVIRTEGFSPYGMFALKMKAWHYFFRIGDIAKAVEFQKKANDMYVAYTKKPLREDFAEALVRYESGEGAASGGKKN